MTKVFSLLTCVQDGVEGGVEQINHSRYSFLPPSNTWRPPSGVEIKLRSRRSASSEGLTYTHVRE